jgi:hypothetical protein
MRIDLLMKRRLLDFLWLLMGFLCSSGFGLEAHAQARRSNGASAMPEAEAVASCLRAIERVNRVNSQPGAQCASQNSRDDSGLSEARQILSGSHGSAPAQPPGPQEAPPAPEMASFKGADGNDVQVSVVSEEQAMEIFRSMRRENLLWSAIDGCAARSHIMGQLLEQRGIITGKVFARPTWYWRRIVPNVRENENGRVRWNFHVAPFIAVRREGRVEKWIIDPSTFSRPVPESQWLEMMSSHPKSSLGNVHTTNRFIYEPADVRETRAAARPQDYRAARARLDEIRRWPRDLRDW